MPARSNSRTESIIAGCSIGECVDRAGAYFEAGADLVVIHSKSWPHLLQVMDRLKAPDALVVIPTMFPQIDLQRLLSTGFKMVIYANQAIRASLQAMESVLGRLRSTGRAEVVENDILPLDRIRDLVGFEDVRSNGSARRDSTSEANAQTVELLAAAPH